MFAIGEVGQISFDDHEKKNERENSLALFHISENETFV